MSTQPATRPLDMSTPRCQPTALSTPCCPVKRKRPSFNRPSSVCKSLFKENEPVSTLQCQSPTEPIVPPESLDLSTQDLLSLLFPPFDQNTVPGQVKEEEPDSDEMETPAPSANDLLSLIFPPVGPTTKTTVPQLVTVRRTRRNRLQPENEETFEGVKVTALLGKHVVLLYRFGELCYPFTLKRSNRNEDVYSCSTCKKIGERETHVKVRQGRFLSNPTEGHSGGCLPKLWAEEMAKRAVYKTNQWVRKEASPEQASSRDVFDHMRGEVLNDSRLAAEEKAEIFDSVGQFQCRRRAIAKVIRKQRSSQRGVEPKPGFLAAEIQQEPAVKVEEPW